MGGFLIPGFCLVYYWQLVAFWKSFKIFFGIYFNFIFQWTAEGRMSIGRGIVVACTMKCTGAFSRIALLCFLWRYLL